MRERLPIILSSTALLVSVLGATPLGEAAYDAVVPRNSVGTAQLKRNAVTSSKIAPNAVRTAHVVNGSLLAEDFRSGQLPKGEKGEKGDKGDRGDPAAVGCPTGTTRFVSACIESTFRGSATWGAASNDCADEQRRLPSSGELAAFARQPGVTIAPAGEWTADLGDITYASTFAFFAFTQTGNGVRTAFVPGPYRCVAGLQNGT